jgi:hypothetical protein
MAAFFGLGVPSLARPKSNLPPDFPQGFSLMFLFFFIFF